MRRRRYPPPSKAAQKLLDYLKMVKNMEKQRGVAKRYDFYRIAGNQSQTDRWVARLEENGLIEGSDAQGYRLTKRGNDWHAIMKTNQELVGLLTTEYSGNRIKRF